MKKLRLSLIIMTATILLTCMFQSGFANNIQIKAKPVLINRNSSAHTMFISFPLSWDNSWKSNTPENWDAAWVFAKYREGGGDWNHVYIDTVHTNHKVKADAGVTTKVGTSMVTSVKDGVDVVEKKGLGLFVYRTDNGKGSINFDTVALKWKYADQDLDDEAVISIRVFAIEMVYVPEGPVEFGDRTGASNTLSYNGNSTNALSTSILFNAPGPNSFVYKAVGTPSYPQYGSTSKAGVNTRIPIGSPVGKLAGQDMAGWYYETCPVGIEIWRNDYPNGTGTSWGLMEMMTTQSFGSPYYQVSPAHGQNYTMDLFKNSGSVGAVGGIERTNGTGARRYIIKFPKPYKVDNLRYQMEHTSWYTSWNEWFTYPNAIMVRAAKADGIKWDTIFGSLNQNQFFSSAGVPTTTTSSEYYYAKMTGQKTLTFNPAKIDSFTYYDILLAPTVTGGTADSPTYYNNNSGTSAGNNLRGGYLYGMLLYASKFYPENAYYQNMKQAYTGNVPLEFVSSGSSVTAHPTYPNGYQGFYMMKYELSQHAYVDFLNCLSEPQQIGRVNSWCGPTAGTEGTFFIANQTTVPTTPRNYVMLKTKNAGQPAYYYCYQSNSRDINDYNTQGGNIAMCGLSWGDCSAYLCWAGLRPLTELEYEKAAKGPSKANNVPLKGAYAWGNNNAVLHTSIQTAGMYTKSEMVGPANANFIVQTTGIFPARVGCLATQTSTRADAGAAYYGAMNLSDNVSEIYVNVSTAKGFAFDGEHGSGNLDGNGNARIATWPSYIDAIGTGIKGIGSASANTLTATAPGADIANRSLMEVAKSARDNAVGCRGGRTAPL